jgi:hypothetical protein
LANKDRRSRISFPEPLELEELESAEDPDVFDRVTAIPDEVHIPPQATKPQDDDPPSGLFERSHETDPLPPPMPTPADGTPAVLGGVNTRPTTPPHRAPPSRQSEPASFELELSEVSTEPPPADRHEELEVVLPTRGTAAGGESSLLDELRGRYATGDFSGALEVAEAILETNPEQEEARRCAARCGEVLSQMYLARLGSVHRRIRVAIPADQIRWLSLDHREGFLLSLAESGATVEEVLDICGMPRLEALRILLGLLDQRVISLID